MTVKIKAYSKYKNSGVEWLGEVPEEWEIKSLKHVSQLFGRIGFRGYSTGDLVDEMEGAITLSPSNMVNGKLNLEKCTYISWEKYNESPEIKVCSNDILIVKTGSTFGKIAYVREVNHPMTVNPQIAVFKKLSCNSKFFYYYVGAPYIQDQISISNTGSTIPTMTQQTIMSYAIPLPPLPEQLSIASFLDRETARIDSLIDKKQRLVKLLKEQRMALISQAVTKGLDPKAKMKQSGVVWLGEVPEHWITKAIKWTTPVFRGASPRPIDDPIYFDEEGEYAWVRISDVTASDVFLNETTQRLSDIGSNLSVKLKPGELFLSIAATVGVPCIANIKCCIHDGFVYFPRIKSNIKFMYYIFACGEPYKGLGKLGTQLNLNTDTIGSIVVGFPPLSEQLAIVVFLDRETSRIDSLIGYVEKAIAALKEHRTALISAAVTGKIDVRGAA